VVAGDVATRALDVELGVGRLRIGYLSGNFHEHPTARLMVGLFESTIAAPSRSRATAMALTTAANYAPRARRFRPLA
jgi:predicted O-linked N-acetylglucosamine transferase (SPINDLY family)